MSAEILPEDVRRLPDGSIDCAHYLARGRRARATAVRGLVERVRDRLKADPPAPVGRSEQQRSVSPKRSARPRRAGTPSRSDRRVPLVAREAAED